MVTYAELIEYGMTLRGKPYVFGAAGPNSFDCSGLMQYIYKHFGISIPRVTYDQVKAGTAVKAGEEKPGDLIFSSWDGTPHSHVGMYIGNDKMLVAPQPGDVVKVQTLDRNYKGHVDAVRRIGGLEGSVLDADTGQSTLDKALGSLNDSSALGVARSTAAALTNLAESAAKIGKVAEWILRLSVPNVAVRVVSGLFGFVLLVIGVILIGREATR